MSGVLLATAGYDHTIRLWEAPSGICYKTMQHPDSQVNKLEISPDKQYIAAAGNPSLRIFDINGSSPNAVSSYDGHTNNVTAVGFQKVRAPARYRPLRLSPPAAPTPTRPRPTPCFRRMAGGSTPARRTAPSRYGTCARPAASGSTRAAAR